MVLPRPGALRASLASKIAQPARAFRTTEQQSWQQIAQRTTRRTYVDSATISTKPPPHLKSIPSPAKKGEDLPWLITAVIVTIPSLWYILQPSADAEHGHGDSHASHAEEGEDKHEEPKEESEPEAKEDSKAEDTNEKASTDDSEGDSKEDKDDESKDDQAKEGEDTTGQKDEEKGYSAKQSGDKAASRDENRDNKHKEKVEKHDEETAQKADPSERDTPDPRKKAKSGDMSGKQEGLSNADTHHSTNVHDNPEKSKKGEGVAETAKLKGTVSVDRPGAESDQRGKAVQDKSE